MLKNTNTSPIKACSYHPCVRNHTFPKIIISFYCNDDVLQLLSGQPPDGAEDPECKPIEGASPNEQIVSSQSLPRGGSRGVQGGSRRVQGGAGREQEGAGREQEGAGREQEGAGSY